ncbi:unnamed protein product, partial [Pylaiella littoralis]
RVVLVVTPEVVVGPVVKAPGRVTGHQRAGARRLSLLEAARILRLRGLGHDVLLHHHAWGSGLFVGAARTLVLRLGVSGWAFQVRPSDRVFRRGFQVGRTLCVTKRQCFLSRLRASSWTTYFVERRACLEPAKARVCPMSGCITSFAS